MGSHKEWRKIAKKERRRKLRIHRAKGEQEKEEYLKTCPEYETWLQETLALEMFERDEIVRQNNEENEKWLNAEKVALEQWKQLQEKIQRARSRRLEQEIRIKEEWEREQKEIEETRGKLKQIEDENKRKHDLFIEKLESYVSGELHDPPEELSIGRETKSNAEICPFFYKTASCRFGDVCSRNHQYPGISKVLLISNFYSQFGLDHANSNEYDTDIMLEYDDKERYKEYKDFFYDFLPEFQKFGKVVQFKIPLLLKIFIHISEDKMKELYYNCSQVCNNYEKHLRGNVYVEYDDLRCAVAAYRALHTRWYAGKQISLQFCNISSWKNAICGLQLSRRCPKGRACNFLHVFRNPDNKFDSFKYQPDERFRNKDTPRHWRWSESPERDIIVSSKRERRHRHSKPSRRKDKNIHDHRDDIRDHRRSPKYRYSSSSERNRKKSRSSK